MDFKKKRPFHQSTEKDNEKNRQISTPVRDRTGKRDTLFDKGPEPDLYKDAERELDDDVDRDYDEDELDDDLLEEVDEEDYDDLYDDDDLDDLDDLDDDDDLDDLDDFDDDDDLDDDEDEEYDDMEIDLDLEIDRELNKPGGIDPARSEASRYNKEELLDDDNQVNESGRVKEHGDFREGDSDSEYPAHEDEKNIYRDQKDDDHRVVN